MPSCLIGVGKLLVLTWLILGANTVYAENFWQTKSQALSAHLGESDSVLFEQYDVDDYFNSVSAQSLSLTHNYGQDGHLMLQRAMAENEQNTVLGLTQGDVSFSFMRGSGENLAKITQDYSGIDPYLFHTGVNQRFDYSGYAINYHLPKLGHLQFGQATVESDGLLKRKASYFEWSSQQLFARYTQMRRGIERIGYAFDAGIAFENKKIAYQTIQLDERRSLRRMRLNIQHNDKQQIWFDIAEHRNSLYEANDDYRFMITFQALIGAQSTVSRHSQSKAGRNHDLPESAKSKKPWKRGLYIGAGVVAAAALSSSGSNSQDDAVRLESQNAAAFDVLNRVNPKSVRENREYGGYIYMNPDGSFSSTPEIRGDATSVTLPAPNREIPLGTRATANYHTHAAFDPRFDNENFSPTDLQSDRDFNLDGYLGTPLGFIKLHEVSSGNITTLGRINN